LLAHFHFDFVFCTVSRSYFLLPTPSGLARGFELPAEALAAPPGEYFAAEIRGGNPKHLVSVYLRRTASGFQVVGIERAW